MNDERPIEKLLRRYAKKRRDDAGAPVELHPATRRLLQGEVTRQFRKAAPGDARASFTQMMKGWLPRLAWAVPLLVLVAVGLWSLLDRPETKQLALGPAPNETAAAAPESQVLSPKPKAAVVPVADARLQTSDSGLSSASVPVRSLNQLATAPADQDAKQALAFAAAPNKPVASLVGAAEQKGEEARDGYNELAQADKFGVASSAARARARFAEASSANRVNTLPADPRTGSDASLQTNRSITGVYAANQKKLNESTARSFDAPALESAAHLRDTPGTAASLKRIDRLEREQAQTYSQSFANLVPEPLKQKTAKVIVPPPLSPVLANFRVEQTGRQLRVVDSDGSTYVGETDGPPEFWGDVGGKKDQAVQSFKRDGKISQLPAAASAPSQQVQNNFYRVVGTNRTLNQAVEFTWSYAELTNAPVLAQAEKIGAELTKDARKLPTQFPVQLQNAFITGRAQFGNGKEIEINAVPVTP